MFDYQAGEKYKLTLIMVGVAGLIAGMFFTLLLMPTEPASAHHKQVAMTRAQTDPDVVGRRGGYHQMDDVGGGGAGGQGGPGAAGAQGGQQAMPNAASMVDRAAAQQFMQNWLPRVWDLNAQTAAANQEDAIKWMTPECAAAYRQNVWSQDMAAQVAQSSLQSEFHIKVMDVSNNLQDGSVVVKVVGTQVLKAPAGQKTKDVNLEYMLSQTPAGVRVAGISGG